MEDIKLQQEVKRKAAEIREENSGLADYLNALADQIDEIESATEVLLQRVELQPMETLPTTGEVFVLLRPDGILKAKLIQVTIYFDETTNFVTGERTEDPQALYHYPFANSVRYKINKDNCLGWLRLPAILEG